MKSCPSTKSLSTKCYEPPPADEVLRDSETRYRRLFETAKDGILILDGISGEITDVNPFLITLLGCNHQELMEKKLWEIGPFKDIFASQVAFRELQQKNIFDTKGYPSKPFGETVLMWSLCPTFMKSMARWSFNATFAASPSAYGPKINYAKPTKSYLLW